MKFEKKNQVGSFKYKKDEGTEIYEGIAIYIFLVISGLGSIQKSPVYQAEKENAHQKGKGFSMESNQRKGSYQEADRGETKVNIAPKLPLFTYMVKLMQSQR